MFGSGVPDMQNGIRNREEFATVLSFFAESVDANLPTRDWSVIGSGNAKP